MFSWHQTPHGSLTKPVNSRSTHVLKIRSFNFEERKTIAQTSLLHAMWCIVCDTRASESYLYPVPLPQLTRGGPHQNEEHSFNLFDILPV